MREYEQWEEDALAEQRELEEFADSPGNLSEAMGRARAGELSWQEIEAYGLRARRAARASNSLADAFSAELKRLVADGKVPAGEFPYFP
jgi:hypothetical protein